MKFLHYNKAWGNFKKYVIMPEIEELRKSGNLYGLAEKICYEWSIISDDIFLSKEVVCLKKIKYKNSTINIVGEANIEKIKQANNLQSVSRLSVGQQLVIPMD